MLCNRLGSLLCAPRISPVRAAGSWPGRWTVYANPVKCQNWTAAEQCCLLLHHREDGLHFDRSKEEVPWLFFSPAEDASFRESP